MSRLIENYKLEDIDSLEVGRSLDIMVAEFFYNKSVLDCRLDFSTAGVEPQFPLPNGQCHDIAPYFSSNYDAAYALLKDMRQDDYLGAFGYVYYSSPELHSLGVTVNTDKYYVSEEKYTEQDIFPLLICRLYLKYKTKDMNEL